VAPSLAARCGAADCRIPGAVPDPCGSAVGADRRGLGLATGVARDVQGPAEAIVDIATHPGIDQEEQTVALEDLAGVAPETIGERDIGGLMTLNQVMHAKIGGKKGQELLGIMGRPFHIDPLHAFVSFQCEGSLQKGVATNQLLSRESIVVDATFEVDPQL